MNVSSTEEMQRLKDKPPTAADLQAKDKRLQELETACAKLREQIATKEREGTSRPGTTLPVEPSGDRREPVGNGPRLAARPLVPSVASGAFGRPEHSLTVGSYGRRDLDLPFTRSMGSYEGRSPTQGPGRLSIGGAPYADDSRGAIVGGARTEEDTGQVRFLR